MSQQRILIIILIVASIAIHFAFFGHPNQIVFDEVHFGKFISAYYTHQYYFDIHPPLGKLLIAGFAKLFHFQPEYSFGQIGQSFPDHAYLVLRFLPVLFGTLLPIIIYFLALEMGFGTLAAFLAGMLVLLDNALLTQSRYILLDMFLLDFGFGALWFYFRYRSKQHLAHWKNLLGMALLGAAAASIKWTGITFLAIAGIMEIVMIVKARAFQARRFVSLVLYFAIIPLIAYFAVFMIHFSLLTKSGDGDAFMTPQFRSTLIGTTEYGEANIKPLNSIQKFIELNKEMYTANKTLTATHPYGSKWYTWPFLIRTIYYWDASASSTGVGEEKIYLLGNPFIWWASTIAVLYVLLELITSRSRNRTIPLFLISAYALNLLPFIGIGRVMFLYHYFTALIFAILMLAYCVDRIKKPRNTVIMILAISAVIFIYFAPLSYGLPLSTSAFNHRMWLSSWQ